MTAHPGLSLASLLYCLQPCLFALLLLLTTYGRCCAVRGRGLRRENLPYQALLRTPSSHSFPSLMQLFSTLASLALFVSAASAAASYGAISPTTDHLITYDTAKYKDTRAFSAAFRQGCIT